MEELNRIETYGTIVKKELLASLEEPFCNNSLVIESKFPFPGYYHNVIPDQEVMIPSSVFMVTENRQYEEKIMRTNLEVKKAFSRKFDAAPGQITVFNEQRTCIRVRHLEDFHDIPELVKLFQKNNIRFMKYREIKPYQGLITINRYFVIESIYPGIYKDLEDPQFCYFQIPVKLDWDTFEKITLHMKWNMEDNKFDAAIGTIIRKNSLMDIVRIYDENVTVEKLINIREKYFDAIKHL
ncbi:MAG: hypothetical protein FJY07_12360 [Bacteroidetes bacterium]|nr:hypothetical protein [Bacteroidota bacterium]